MKTIFKFTICIIILYGCSRKNDIVSEIPFDIKGNQIILGVRINGDKLFNFRFDSGSENTSIDSIVAKEIDLKIDSIREVICVGGLKQMSVASADFSINGFQLKRIPSLLISTKKSSDLLDIPVAGIIGLDLFRNNIIKISFSDKTIELYRQGFVFCDSTYQVFEFVRGPAVIATTVLFNSFYDKGYYIIDTGSNSALSMLSVGLDSTDAEEYIGKFVCSYSTDMCGNRKLYYKGKAKNFYIGQTMLDLVDVSVADTYFPNADINYSGLVGMKILQKFDIVIDYPNSRIYLKQIA